MKKIDGCELINEFDLEKAQNSIGEVISIQACVHKVRQMSGFAFVVLRTARYLIQSVYSPENCS